jgi:hypothetical protein
MDHAKVGERQIESIDGLGVLSIQIVTELSKERLDRPAKGALQANEPGYVEGIERHKGPIRKIVNRLSGRTLTQGRLDGQICDDWEEGVSERESEEKCLIFLPPPAVLVKPAP